MDEDEYVSARVAECVCLVGAFLPAEVYVAVIDSHVRGGALVSKCMLNVCMYVCVWKGQPMIAKKNSHMLRFHTHTCIITGINTKYTCVHKSEYFLLNVQPVTAKKNWIAILAALIEGSDQTSIAPYREYCMCMYV